MDKIHRTDGPAVIKANGDKYWCSPNKRYSFEDYVKKAKWSDEQIVMYKLQYFLG